MPTDVRAADLGENRGFRKKSPRTQPWIRLECTHFSLKLNSTLKRLGLKPIPIGFSDMGQKGEQTYRAKVDLIWALLFGDIVFLFLRFGGNAYLDQLVHGAVIAVAAGLAIHLRRQLTYPRLFLPICYAALGLALFQLLPLGATALAWLSPAKASMQQAAQALYPEIPTTTSMAVVPQLHLLEAAGWCLDLFLVFLLLVVPRPRGTTFFRGFYGVGFLVCALAIGIDNPVSAEMPPFSWYQGTYGGLVNRNHFALLAVGLVLMSYYKIILSVGDFWRDRKKLRQNADRAARQVLAVVCYIMAFAFFFFTFTQTWSRAGVMGFLIGHLVLLLILTWHYMQRSRRRKYLMPAIAAAFVVLLLFLPLGSGLERLKKYGLEDRNRFNLLSIGWEYVQQAPLFGHGLGSPQEMIDPVEPRYLIITRNMRHFHNEYLELLVEMGPLALLALLCFIAYVVWEQMTGLNESDEGRKLLAAVMLSVTLVFLAAAFVAFPLQTPAMRTFALVVLFYSLKYIHRDDSVYKVTRPALLMGLPLLAFGLLVPASWLPHYLNNDLQTHKAERARGYGFFYREPFYEANVAVQNIFTELPPADELAAEIPQMRAELVRYLGMQPFGLKALNNLFVLEVLEERLRDPAFTEAQYTRFHQKATALRAIGKDANFHAVASLYFLGSVYDGQVPEAYRAEWEALKNDVYIRRFATRKQKELAPEDFEDAPSARPEEPATVLPEGAANRGPTLPVGDLSALQPGIESQTVGGKSRLD